MMEKKDVKKTIENILDNSYIGTMATISNDRPNSRYMTFFHEGMKLYTITSKETHKVDELEKNPYAHILLGYDGEGFGDDYVEYEGKVKESSDQQLIDKLWSDKMKVWFSGPEDKDILILEVEPLHIRLMNKKGQPPQELDL